MSFLIVIFCWEIEIEGRRERLMPNDLSLSLPRTLIEFAQHPKRFSEAQKDSPCRQAQLCLPSVVSKWIVDRDYRSTCIDTSYRIWIVPSNDLTPMNPRPESETKEQQDKIHSKLHPLFPPCFPNFVFPVCRLSLRVPSLSLTNDRMEGDPSITAVAIWVPPFWCRSPGTWFRQLEILGCIKRQLNDFRPSPGTGGCWSHCRFAEKTTICTGLCTSSTK